MVRPLAALSMLALAVVTTADVASAANPLVIDTRPMSAVGRNHAAGNGGATVNDHRTHNAELVLRVPITVTHMDSRAASIVVSCRGQGGPWYDETRPWEDDTSGGTASMALTDGAYKGTIAVPMTRGYRNAVRGTAAYGCELRLTTHDNRGVAIDAFGLNPTANNVTKILGGFHWR